MHFPELLLKKRNGGKLSPSEIAFFVSGYVDGTIPDYQVAALLMAIWFVGMDAEETAALTFAMRDSGEVIDLSAIGGVIADKHSTGGVADTTTLITVPLVAACGVKVAKLSGRGLGHTGGTIDKLESIPGFSTELSMERFAQVVNECGMSVIGQTREIVPADKLLYALRDTTGTVDNISLIASSIMSKKLASGSSVIVLDVKTGNGSFMKKTSEAVKLAEEMVSIGKRAGKKVVGLVTDMNQPLGNGVGNSLEIKEAIETLQGKHEGDLRRVALALAARMILLSGKAADEGEALIQVEEALVSGRGLQHLAKMIAAQGGDAGVCQDTGKLPSADELVPVVASRSGYIQEILTDEVGMSALLLGAGRMKKSDRIDVRTGLWLNKRRGDYVQKGEELAVLHVTGKSNTNESRKRLVGAYRLGDEQPEALPLIYEVVS